MSRAEEQALKAYPNIKIGEQRIDQSSAREVYVEATIKPRKTILNMPNYGWVKVGDKHFCPDCYMKKV